MSHLDILLPFGLPPAEMASDLLRELKVPALATLIARGQSFQPESFDGFSRALPHEVWLARQCGLTNCMPADGSPPVAVAAMQALGLTAGTGIWFVLNPVHIHIARDHLVLTDQRQLTLPGPESRALFEVAAPLFAEADKTLLYGDARTWFLHADDWHDLQTSTPDATCGHNIDIWMPKGTCARAWRKLQNEVQMHWHAHPVNAEHEARNVKAVNSLWLWGGASTTMQAGLNQYKKVFSPVGGLRGFSHLAISEVRDCSVSELAAAMPERALLILESPMEAALGNDWSSWLAQIHSLESTWFAPLMAALQSGKIRQISLILTHGSGISKFTASQYSVRKFWIKPALTRLRS